MADRLRAVIAKNLSGVLILMVSLLVERLSFPTSLRSSNAQREQSTFTCSVGGKASSYRSSSGTSKNRVRIEIIRNFEGTKF